MTSLQKNSTNAQQLLADTIHYKVHRINVEQLNRDQYIKYCWQCLDDYIYSVKSGKRKACKEEKWAVARYEKDLKNKDFVFKKDKVERVFKFFYYLNVNNKNGGYRRLKIVGYQAFTIANIFGFYFADNLDKDWAGMRRFNTSFIFIARKNGKSTFSAAITLYALLADGQTDPEVLYTASTRDQAQHCLKAARGIIFNSKAINERITPNRYELKYKDRRKTGFAKIISSIAKKQDGYNPSFAVLDETHALENHDMYNVIYSGMGFRLNPHIMMITTAGFTLDSLAHDYLETGSKVLNPDNETTDDRTFFLIFRLELEKEVYMPEMWEKANPAIEETQQKGYIEAKFEKAKFYKSELIDFLTKQCNIFTSSNVDWIREDELKPLFVEKIPLSEEQIHGPEYGTGLAQYIGVDLSATKDITSVVCLYYDEEKDHFYVRPYFHKAFDLKKRQRKGGKDLTSWIEDKLINEHTTSTIDFNLISSQIIELAHKNNHYTEVAYDPMFATMLVSTLQQERIKCTSIAQTAVQFNEPLKFLETLVVEKKITFENEVLLWMFGNAVVKVVDGNGNIKVMKNESLDAVDGVVALAMALKLYLKYV